MIDKLKEQDYRLTPQRLAVLKILAESDSHPSAEHIYEQVKVDFPMTSLATIYKTLTLLKEIKEVLEISIGDDHKHYDGRRPYPHPHLICNVCKKILDTDMVDLSNVSQHLAKKTGYQITNYRIDFFGICPLCQNKV